LYGDEETDNQSNAFSKEGSFASENGTAGINANRDVAQSDHAPQLAKSTTTQASNPQSNLLAIKIRNALKKLETCHTNYHKGKMGEARFERESTILKRQLKEMMEQIRRLKETEASLESLTRLLTLEILAATSSHAQFQSHLKSLVKSGEMSSEIYEIWLREEVKWVTQNKGADEDIIQQLSATAHDIYAKLMSQDNMRPTLPTIRLIVQHTDSPHFLGHAVKQLFDILDEERGMMLPAMDGESAHNAPRSSFFHAQTPSQLLATVDPLVIQLMNEIVSKIVTVQNTTLLKSTISKQASLGIPFNFETSSRILSLFCQQQDFTFALRFVTSMMPKFSPSFNYHSQAQPIFHPENALLLILNVASEMGESVVVETVVMELTQTLGCDIETLPEPINSIVFHAVFKTYLLNQEFDRALETISRMNENGIEMNWRLVLSTIQMLLQSEQRDETTSPGSSSIIWDLIDSLQENPHLISGRIVAILIRSCASVGDIEASQDIYDEFCHKSSHPENIHLAMAHTLCSTAQDESQRDEGLRYFQRALQTPAKFSNLHMDELHSFCALFFETDMEVTIEVFVHIYNVFEDKTSVQLLSQVLKRAYRQGLAQPVEHVLEANIKDEHWPMVEQAKKDIQRNKRLNTARFMVSPNQLQYEVEDDLNYGNGAPKFSRWWIDEEV